jgi:hypothetical protein
MPRPVPFTVEPYERTTDVAPIGMRQTGVVSMSSQRVRLERALMFLPVVGLVWVSDRYESKPGQATMEELWAAMLVYLSVGLVVAGLPLLLFRNNRLTFTVEHTDGRRVRFQVTSRELAKRMRKDTSSTRSMFRPQVVDQNRVQVELRANWKGDGWEIFVPEDVSEDALEDHLRHYLPRLAKALEHPG